MRKGIYFLSFITFLLTAQWSAAQNPKTPTIRKLVLKDTFQIKQNNKKELERLVQNESKYIAITGPYSSTRRAYGSWLGQKLNREVYLIEMTQVVSKYIGETEKNLARVFDEADSKNWILFFDEADALFGKRTPVRDAHDKYANQEVAYLIQRIENYAGIVVLASNNTSRYDSSFLRKFRVFKSD